MSAGLHPVRVELWCPKGPDISWQVLALRGTEALSRPYEFELELACDDPTVDAEAMLGADAELLLDRDGLTREFYGVIIEVEVEVGGGMVARDQIGHEGLCARVRLAPAFRLLEQELDTRFFAGQTVVEILAELLGGALARYGRELDLESRLRRAYNSRDYCVQFRESSFDFCSRIMEEEGISYLFVPDHANHRELMVLVDDNEAAASVELLVPGAIPILAASLERESIQRLDWRSRRTPNRVLTRGYNYKQPARLDEGEAESLDRHQPRDRAQHLDGERRQIIDDPVGDPRAQTFTGAELDQRSTQAALLLQRHQLEAAGGRGSSNVTGFAAGAVFELGEGAGAGLRATGGEHELLLVEVAHHAKLNETPGAVDHAYGNRFECIARARPFRPAQATRRPRVYGVQTGVVTGPAADEIYTDALGRVKVKLHTDRHSGDDEHASCWIRVAQIWAGPGYGAVVIPRVGMEVVVSFVDGNPDCPLVTGCVYDGVNAPPHALPESPSRSTFKSSSTPGGGGFNELRFEDGSGREQIFVHAQRRMDLRVGGSLYETCAGNHEQVIGGGPLGHSHGDRNSLVNRDVNEKVRGSRYAYTLHDDYRRAGDGYDALNRHTINANERVQLSTMKLVVETSELVSHKSDKIVLAGSSDITLKAGAKLVLESNNRIELKVGNSFISIAPEGIDIQGPKLRLNSGGRVGEASEGERAESFEMLFPLEAYAADTGRGGAAGRGGGGGGGGRTRDTVRVDPPHAPPMTPPPKIPAEVMAEVGQGSRELLSLAWVERSVWCSEPTPLWANLDRDGASQVELLRVKSASEGEELATEIVEVGPGLSLSHELTIKDVLPRQNLDRHPEDHRDLVASLRDVQTAVAIRLRFLSSLTATHYQVGRASFHIRVEHHCVEVGGTIEYTRGWLHYVIDLGEMVPSEVGGLIGAKLCGHGGWRYCKKSFTDGGTRGLAYWDGASWEPVPQTWSDDLGTKLYGSAVWCEDGVAKTQNGTLAWPDPVPEWSAGALQDKNTELERAADDIELFWAQCFALKRVECLSGEPSCCHHQVDVAVDFAERDVKRRGGIILTENDSRANMGAWSYDVSSRTVIHEFGHLLGNPDEYAGASTVDPSVNGDGATAGIDRDSIMGSGETPRRRHYDTICTALTKLVEERTGKSFTYKVIDC